MPITGQCRCGAVKFEAAEPPVTTRVCWCSDCQKWACGNSTVNVVFKTESVSITGEMIEFVSNAASGNVMRRHFCKICCTPMFSAADIRPHLLIVRAGALDDASVAQPSMTIWTSSAPAWALIDPNLPQHEKGAPA